MTDSELNTNTSTDSFEWHPEYEGKTFESVRRNLIDEIARDQNAYHLALEQAEKKEHDAFNSIREIEKRWSEYDFGWAEVDPELLADRIVAFEQARDKQQVMMSWQAWKRQNEEEGTQLPTMPRGSGEKRDWREDLSEEQRRKLASGISVAIIFIMILACAGVYMLIR